MQAADEGVHCKGSDGIFAKSTARRLVRREIRASNALSLMSAGVHRLLEGAQPGPLRLQRLVRRVPGVSHGQVRKNEAADAAAHIFEAGSAAVALLLLGTNVSAVFWRVRRGLMAKEDLNQLGFGENQEYKRGPSNEGKRECQCLL
jgi:hypothetical protein